LRFHPSSGSCLSEAEGIFLDAFQFPIVELKSAAVVIEAL
jgi:hypothetical protein